jgi:hypothetical protein
MHSYEYPLGAFIVQSIDQSSLWWFIEVNLFGVHFGPYALVSAYTNRTRKTPKGSTVKGKNALDHQEPEGKCILHGYMDTVNIAYLKNGMYISKNYGPSTQIPLKRSETGYLHCIPLFHPVMTVGLLEKESRHMHIDTQGIKKDR